MTTREWFRILRGSMWAAPGSFPASRVDRVAALIYRSHNVPILLDVGWRLFGTSPLPREVWEEGLRIDVETRDAVQQAPQELERALNEIGYARLGDVVRNAAARQLQTRLRTLME